MHTEHRTNFLSHSKRLFAAGLVLGLLLPSMGCSAAKFFGYRWFPDYPTAEADSSEPLTGLAAPVTVTVRADGLYGIAAGNETDLYRSVGYLMARDRMFQMDLMRHMAKGELASLLGNIQTGQRSTLEVDVFNRFLGLGEQGARLAAELDGRDAANLQAFAEGVNAWIATGRKSLEHRLLNTEVAAWKPADSMAIFRLLMFGLTHNYTRELRRLLVACDAGLEAVGRVWPTDIEFGPYLLPPADVGQARFPKPPSVAPELAATLPDLCPEELPRDGIRQARRPGRWAAADTSRTGPIAAVAEQLTAFMHGLETSNNWSLAATRTADGLGAIVANDPHLPHLNPPIVWGARYELPGAWSAGFALPGVPYMVFANNGHVAWSLTINNVDLQDLYVLAPGPEAGSYRYDDGTTAYTTRTERFEVKGGRSVTATARFSRHGVVLNDIDPFLAGRIPPVSLKTVDLAGARDAHAFRDLIYARSASELVASATAMDSACLNWVYGDAAGTTGWISPCRVPVRTTHLGDFPAPGWLPAYEWQGYYDKARLPTSVDPKRGWLATGNNRVMPVGAFPTPYDNDPSPPNRYLQIGEALSATTAATVGTMAELQLDVGESYWPMVRRQLDHVFCVRHPDDGSRLAQSRASLCAWDGSLDHDSVAATLFVLLTHELLDRALADDLSAGAGGELWDYLQRIPHFETNVDWLFHRPASDHVWDDATTAEREDRTDIYESALAGAVAAATGRYGPDMRAWAWGDVRPFVLEHPFGSRGGMIADLFNSATYPGRGAPETVFKHQFLRADRRRMHPGIGAVVHLIHLPGDGGGTWYNLAGGQSGWPGSPHYADQIDDWQNGRLHRLDRDEDVDATIRLLPEVAN